MTRAATTWTTVLLWIAAIGGLTFLALLLTLRYLLLPQIDSYRSEIAALIGERLKRPVALRQIVTHWHGMRPSLDLYGVEIRDLAGRPALSLDHVEAELSWSSLWNLELRFARLELDAPQLDLRRDAAGRWFVAGLQIDPHGDGDDDDNEFAAWLFDQHSIVINRAQIVWRDELRAAPPLVLRQLNFKLINSGKRHRFGLTAIPPTELAAPFDLRGDIEGKDVKRRETWRGELYANVERTDLAAWTAWIDYPLPIPTGHGALRLWAGFADKRLNSLTADLNLDGVRLRLQPELPELELKRLSGRIAARRLANGVELRSKQLGLDTADGIEIAPTEMKLVWLDATPQRPATGAANIDRFDLKAYTQLSAYLPLPAALREKLALIAPQGRLTDFQLDWKGLPAALAATAPPTPAAPLQWSLRSRFEALGWNAFEPMPGANGIDGFIDGNQDRGSVQLGGQRAWVDLPKVFADPRVALDAFQADLGWKTDGDDVRVDIKKATFNNADGNGEARGYWRSRGQGPGEIDLSARLARGNATAVWRYIPLQVGAQVREWLRTGLLGGHASDVTVTLKGNLDKFPFRGAQGGRDDRGGLFEVRGKIHDATLHYADRWPGIAQIDGELLFAGERMLITGRRGKIGEIDLREVTAEIADIEQKEEILIVKGKAGGNTAHFLKFIAASPVDAWIDHSTAEMRADGPGELDLKLTLPLQRIETTRIEGSYRFDGAQVKVDADLPPLTEVRGPLRFTGDSLEARGLRANLLGSPFTVDIKSAGGGQLQVNAQGEIGIANLAREFPHPLFAHLSGVAPWQATIRGKKESAEVRVVSNLLGVSSSLPAPFNKSAAETMAFGFERKAAPPRAKVGADETARRDLIDLSLGKAHLQAVRRHDPAAAWPTLERGFLTIGEMAAPPLPERSLAIAIDQPRLNVDFWRELLQNDAPQRPAASTAATMTLPPLAIDLRCADLTVFDKSFHDVRLNVQRNDALLSRIDLKSRELTGRFDWNGSGAGKLSGRIAQFAIPDSAVSNFDADALQAKADQVIDSLPALDIAIDKLAYKDRTLGTVGIAAENRDGFWHTKIYIKNEDGALTVNGRWKPSPTQAAIQPKIQPTIQPNTRLDFSLDSRSIDRLLVRFGYPNTVKRGAVNLSGAVSWNGPPFVVDYPSMSGQMKLDAVNGQFNKLEPGVGRLLGILSLQSLPRRITLDFRDIFSEGLAFDTIAGQFDIARGIMHTKNLQIQGPSARITMDGAIDLGEETQQLKVRVQPTIGESFAVGTAMLASPIAGAVAWVAQKMLKDPLDQAFSFEYAVSGGWNDPKVEKLKGAPRAVKPTETTP